MPINAWAAGKIINEACTLRHAQANSPIQSIFVGDFQSECVYSLFHRFASSFSGERDARSLEIASNRKFSFIFNPENVTIVQEVFHSNDNVASAWHSVSTHAIDFRTISKWSNKNGAHRTANIYRAHYFWHVFVLKDVIILQWTDHYVEHMCVSTVTPFA